jgi:DNA-binding PadR family transcriptional regulator
VLSSAVIHLVIDGEIAMRTVDLKRVILKMFKDKEFYGYEVHKRLASEDIKVELSSLYRILNEMVRERLLVSRWEKSQFGPEKRLYQLDKKGRKELDKILSDAIRTVHSFYGDYLMRLPPKMSAFDNICGLITDKLKGEVNIAYVTTENSMMHERMIRGLRNEVRGRIYVVEPRSVVPDLRFDNLVFLDGDYGNIPLRDEHIDVVVVIDMPPKDFLEKTLREWCRVLKQTGRLAILTPTVLLGDYKDPLTIGGFIEKYEHEVLEKNEHVEKTFLETLLKNSFENVIEKQVVHMTIFLASQPRISGK